MVNLDSMAAAEQAVLGSLLIDEGCIGPALAELTPEDFVLETNRTIYQSIRKLFSAGERVDPVTVLDDLGRPAGMYDYLQQLLLTTPTAANWQSYAAIVRQQSREYRVENLSAELREAAGMEAKAEVLARINSLFSERRGARVTTMKDAMSGFFDRHRTKKEYLRWGFMELNDRLFVAEGAFVILGGYPSDGKTAFALATAWEQAETHRVGFFSLETDDGTLTDRLVSRVALLDMGKIKRSELDETDYDVVAHFSPRIAERKLEIVSAAGMTVDDIFAVAQSRRYEIIYIDYIQLIRGERKFGRVNEVTGISLDLHSRAQTTGITVVGLSQLSRGEKPKQGKERQAPTMQNLRESGQLEQDADVVILLYRSNPANPYDKHRYLDIVKNKEGQVGGLSLVFDGKTQSFRKDYAAAEVRAYEEEAQEDAEPEYEQYTFEEKGKSTRIPEEWKAKR